MKAKPEIHLEYQNAINSLIRPLFNEAPSIEPWTYNKTLEKLSNQFKSISKAKMRLDIFKALKEASRANTATS